MATQQQKTAFFISIFLVASVLVYAQKTTPSEVKFPNAAQFEHSIITYKIISSANHTYGYDIYANDKLLIHQPSMPGIPGNEGFPTEESAKKIAEIVIDKIKKGEMPPTVSKEELIELKAPQKVDKPQAVDTLNRVKLMDANMPH